MLRKNPAWAGIVYNEHICVENVAKKVQHFQRRYSHYILPAQVLKHVGKSKLKQFITSITLFYHKWRKKHKWKQIWMEYLVSVCMKEQQKLSFATTTKRKKLCTSDRKGNFSFQKKMRLLFLQLTTTRVQ